MYNKQRQSNYFTADGVISKRPGWLHYAAVIPTGATTNTYLYDGQNTTGDKIIPLQAAAATLTPFAPAKPIYFKKGLYLDVGTDVSGVFVQWEEETEEKRPHMAQPPVAPAEG